MRAKLRLTKKVMDDILNPPEICFYADSKSIDQEFPNGLVTSSELDRYEGKFEEVKRIEIKSGISQIDCWTLDRLRNLEEIEFVKEELLTHAMYGFKVLFEKTQDDPKIWKRIAKPFKLSRATKDEAKIIDLTGGKYRDLYDPDDNSRDESFNKYLSQISRFSSCYKPFLTKGNSIKKIKEKLYDIPVYLVESSMSGTEKIDPVTNDSIFVPNYIKVPNIPVNLDIKTWKSQKIDGIKIDEIKNVETNYNQINDFLGLYVSVSNGGPRIFIWMDRIYNTAKEDTKSGDVTANAILLFHKVFCHEMAHALMDVELCGLKHNDKFTYSDDWVYMIFEEAYANSIALQVLKKSKKRITPFIEDSVTNAGPGYASGWALYKHNSCNLDQWIAIKMLFNNYIANLIEDSWNIYYENNRIVIAPTYYRCENGKIEVRDKNNNWQTLDVAKLKK